MKFVNTFPNSWSSSILFFFTNDKTIGLVYMYLEGHRVDAKRQQTAGEAPVTSTASPSCWLAAEPESAS